MSIVVGYVATPEGEAALDAAVEEARARGVRLVVVLGERGHRSSVQGDELEQRERDVQGRLGSSGLTFEVRRTAHGRDVAEEIVGAATETDAVLIVIGLRRRSPVGKLLLGSNAQRILLDAPCQVLAVKPVQ